MIVVSQEMTQAGLAAKPLCLWLIFWYFQLPTRECHGGQQDTLGCHRGCSARGNSCARHTGQTRTRGSPAEGEEPLYHKQVLEARNETTLAPLLYFSIFYQHQFDNP